MASSQAQQIRGLDRTIKQMAERYPEIHILRTVPGV
jgi:hypothetical protein